MQQLEALLLRHDLYVPTAAELNEPRESRPRLVRLSMDEAVDYLKRMLPPPCNQEARILEVIREAGMETIMELITEIAFHRYDEIRIYSMSKRWDNMALWIAGGACHTGYCLDFLNTGLFRLAREVIYTTQHVNVDTPAERGWIYYKSSDWQHEEEIRFFMVDDYAAQPMRILPNQLSRVILGKDMRTVDAKHISKWAARRDPRLKVVRVVDNPHLRRLTLKRLTMH